MILHERRNSLLLHVGLLAFVARFCLLMCQALYFLHRDLFCMLDVVFRYLQFWKACECRFLFACIGHVCSAVAPASLLASHSRSFDLDLVLAIAPWMQSWRLLPSSSA